MSELARLLNDADGVWVPRSTLELEARLADETIAELVHVKALNTQLLDVVKESRDVIESLYPEYYHDALLDKINHVLALAEAATEES